MDQSGGSHSDPFGRFSDDVLDHCVPACDGRRECTAADRGDLGADVLGQVRSLSAVGGLGRGGGDRQAARDVLQCAASSVTSGRATRIDGDVTDLHAADPVSSQNPTLVDAAASDAGSRENAHHAAGSSSGAETEFAVDSRVDVVDDQDRAVHLLGQPVADLDVAPAEVDRLVHHTGGHVDGAGAADADPADRVSVQARLGQCLVDRLGDPLEVFLGGDGVESRFSGAADHFERRIIDAGQHLGAAQVKAHPHSVLSCRHAANLLRGSMCLNGAYPPRRVDAR